jgi:hypothetical protein
MQLRRGASLPWLLANDPPGNALVAHRDGEVEANMDQQELITRKRGCHLGHTSGGFANSQLGLVHRPRSIGLHEHTQVTDQDQLFDI